MAFNKIAQGMVEGIGVERSAQAQPERHVVGRALWFEPVQEPLLFLRKTKRCANGRSQCATIGFAAGRARQTPAAFDGCRDRVGRKLDRRVGS